MIKIPLSKNQKCKIEKMYWDWFAKYHIENMINIVKNDKWMNCLVLGEKGDLKKSIQIEGIQKFLLSDYKELKVLKNHIDTMRKNGKEINKESKAYLYARYENFRKSQAGKFVDMIGVTVCPYCNQNHINLVYDKNNKVRFWGELDHFYAKSLYPELVVCLYNMIPACKICNQLKTNQKGEIENPYNCEAKSGIKFKTEFDENIDLNYLIGESDNFNIVINKYETTKEDLEEINIFDLERRYKLLKRNVQEIIVKSKAYDILYQNQLKKDFNINDEELKSYIFGYTDDHLNRTLSKFNLDIMNEFRNGD